MAVKYLAGDRLIGTAAERAALETTTPAAVPQTTGNATDFGADLGNQSGGDGTAASWSCDGCAA